MTVRAHRVAHRELLLEEAGASSWREGCEVIHFRRAGAVVECHRDRMEPSAAVDTRIVLELTHALHESLSAPSSLLSSQHARRRVIPGVIRAPTFLAPPLISLATPMELGQRL